MIDTQGGGSSYYQQVEVASGSGYKSLSGASSYIKSQLGTEVPGDLYEMEVYFNAPSWMIGTAVRAANTKFNGSSAKPWPQYNQICMQDSSNPKLFYFRWTV